MLLIGADEAGYGPRIGPLVACACAFRVPDDPACASQGHSLPVDGAPDLWRLLAPVVRRAPPAPPALTVDDSKRVFIRGSADALGELRRVVGAFLMASAGAPVPAAPGEGGPPRSSPAARGFLEVLLPPECLHAWRSEKFAAPVRDTEDPEGGGDAIPLPGVRLADELADRDIAFLGFSCRWVTPRQFNAALDAGLNKADINWQCLAEAARALAGLALPGERIVMRFDRLGGRRFYAARLAYALPAAFPGRREPEPRPGRDRDGTSGVRAIARASAGDRSPGRAAADSGSATPPRAEDRPAARAASGSDSCDPEQSADFRYWLATVVRETPRESRYLLGDSVDIAFRVGADRDCLPVALSSMAAKLLRELAMGRINAFFRSRMPSLRPTAGYPQDAARFLRETGLLRRAMGIEDDSFIRRV